MRRRLSFFAAVGFVLVVLDQWTKLVAVQYLTPAMKGLDTFSERLAVFYGDLRHPCQSATSRADCPEIPFWGGWWTHEYAENPGAAWSFLARADADFRVPFFVSLSAIALVAIVYFVRKLEPGQKLQLVALSLVFGGALGNFIDRVRMGYVIDFIVWYIHTYRWPTFNVADSAISTGVVLLLLETFFEKSDKVPAPEPQEAEKVG